MRFTPLSDDQSSGEDQNRPELTVKGALIANGTASDTIVFTSNAETPASGDWYGIYLKDSNASGSFKYNNIAYATYGIRSYGLYGSNSDTTWITNNRIHHSGSGVYSYYSGRYDVIEDNNIHDLSGYGINVQYNDTGSGRFRRNIMNKVQGRGIHLYSKGPYYI